MKTCRVVVTWSMFGVTYIDAKSREDAIQKAVDNERTGEWEADGLPDDQNYVSGSFNVDECDVVDVIE